MDTVLLMLSLPNEKADQTKPGSRSERADDLVKPIVSLLYWRRERFAFLGNEHRRQFRGDVGIVDCLMDFS